MKAAFSFIAIVLLISLPAAALGQGFQDELLERLAGNWIMEGIIAGTETTHDIEVKWVLILMATMKKKHEPS